MMCIICTKPARDRWTTIDGPHCSMTCITVSAKENCDATTEESN